MARFFDFEIFSVKIAFPFPKQPNKQNFLAIKVELQ